MLKRYFTLMLLVVFAVTLNAKKNDIIVLAGKGHELYRIDKNGEYFFDEREIVAKV